MAKRQAFEFCREELLIFKNRDLCTIETLPDGMVGHPSGLEWFCGEHLTRARSFAHLPLEEAMERLRGGAAD